MVLIQNQSQFCGFDYCEDTEGLTSPLSLPDDLVCGDAEAVAESCLDGEATSPGLPQPLTRT
jgi:hypothetical protein